MCLFVFGDGQLDQHLQHRLIESHKNASQEAGKYREFDLFEVRVKSLKENSR